MPVIVCRCDQRRETQRRGWGEDGDDAQGDHQVLHDDPEIRTGTGFFESFRIDGVNGMNPTIGWARLGNISATHVRDVSPDGMGGLLASVHSRGATTTFWAMRMRDSTVEVAGRQV